MGPGGIIDVAHAAAMRMALESWGGAIGRAVEELTPALAGVRTPSFAEGAATLGAVDDALIRTAGWKLRTAFRQVDDGRCIKRAMFGALSLAEDVRGGIAPAVGSLARGDALDAAVIVAYRPTNLTRRLSLHAATVARGTSGELLAIDHLVASADDGVMTVRDWLRSIGGTERQTTIISPLHLAPNTMNSGPVGPSLTRPLPAADWSEYARNLASSFGEAV